MTGPAWIRSERNRLLDKAIELIKTHGWTPNTYCDGERYCMLGAIGAAAEPSLVGVNYDSGPAPYDYGDPWADRSNPWDSALRRLGLPALGILTNSIVDTNDSKGFDQEQAIAYLESLKAEVP